MKNSKTRKKFNRTSSDPMDKIDQNRHREEEKIHILLYPEPEKLLNKRSELIARCRHRAKFKLYIINLKIKKKHRIKLRINVNE